MKKILIKITFIASTIFMVSNSLIAQNQQNTIPANGNVGLGVLAPTTKFQVNGTVRIDSSMVVKDSVKFEGDLHVVKKTTMDDKVVMKDDARIKKDLRVDGKTKFFDNVVVEAGELKLLNLVDSTLVEDELLLIKSNGKVVKGGDLQKSIYLEIEKPCKNDVNGMLMPVKPIWNNKIDVLYTFSNCVPNARVGIATPNPRTRLEVNGSTISNRLLLGNGLTDQVVNAYNQASNQNVHFYMRAIQNINGPNYDPTAAVFTIEKEETKLFQIRYDGLVQAREIKVDLQSWPDYVFEEKYKLMPIADIENYINENKHLPNVPSAKQILEEGLALGEMDKILMEKVEELTLYLIEQNKKNELQDAELQELKKQNLLLMELVKQLTTNGDGSN